MKRLLYRFTRDLSALARIIVEPGVRRAIECDGSQATGAEGMRSAAEDVLDPLVKAFNADRHFERVEWIFQNCVCVRLVRSLQQLRRRSMEASRRNEDKLHAWAGRLSAVVFTTE